MGRFGSHREASWGPHAREGNPRRFDWGRVVGWLFALAMLVVAALFLSELAP